MKRSIFIICLCILLIPRLYSLPVKTTVIPVASCPGAYTVAIGVENCIGIGAMSLKLNYDVQHVTYLGYQNFNPILSNGMTLINAINGQVIVSWASVQPDTIMAGTLVEFRFSSASPGTYPFQWNTVDCEYSDGNGNIMPSTYVDGSATIYTSPAIVQQPVNKVTYVGYNTSFYAGVTGNGLTYLWQLSTNGGSSWGNLSNTAPYSGATSSTLSITSASLGLSGNMYRCQISGTCPSPVTSNSALLLVYAVINASAPTVNPCAGGVSVPITVQNCNGVGAISLKLDYNTSLLVYTGYQNVNPALASGITVINENNGEITFSWANTVPINLGTEPLFEVLFTSIVGSAYLNWNTSVSGNCEFSDSYGNIINSTYVNGTVNTLYPPAITSHPANKSILTGQNTSFSVSATGAGLGYLWQLSTNGGSSWSNLSNVAPYSGVTAATLSITAVTQGMNGYKYRCNVSGTCPSPLTSNTASLTVTTAPTPVTTTIGSVSNSCTGSVSVPVNVLNCNNVGAISLVLIFDTTKLDYAGYYSVNSALSNGFLMINRAGNKVILSFASMSAVNIASGTLVNYQFTARSASTATLSWDTQTSGNCEYSDINGAPISGVFNNGTISYLANALIVNAGNDLGVPTGQSVQMNATVSGGVPAFIYSWTPSTGLSNPNILNPAASPSATTTYRLTVTGSNSCAAWDEVIVSTILPITKSWIGVIDDNWNTPGNWSPSVIPTSVDNVIVNAGAPFQPVVKISGFSCQDVLIKNGATLVINNGVIFTVNGDMTLEAP